jgi:choline dehydrogenase-like flavoprotein
VPEPEIPNPGSAGFKYDAIVVGTGFGGAVTACRLAQAGVKVCILERGRRYALSDFPALPRPGEFMPDSRRWTWAGSQGLWDIRNLEGVMVAQAAGYGGGSLVYANVHLRPPPVVFDPQHWPAGINRPALDPFYDLVAYMLEVAPLPVPWRGIGKAQAMAGAFQQAVGANAVFFPPLAIRFPNPAPLTPPGPATPPLNQQLQPNAHGRLQGECQRCGSCDLGCRYGAKNTLDLNYLAVAEQTGNVTVRTLSEAVMISPAQAGGQDGYRVDVRDHLTETTHAITSRYLFLCGGSINTTDLLLRSLAQANPHHIHDPNLGPGLPRPIPGVGEDYFVNADSLAMVLDTERPVGPSAGPVITTALIHNQQPPATWLHRRGRPHRHGQQVRTFARREWFMIQDGGYPAEVARFFGAFSSPALLGRNRFDPGGPDPTVTVPGGLPPMGRPDRYSTFLEGAYAALREGELPDVLPQDFLTARDGMLEIVRRRWHEFLGDSAVAVRNDLLSTFPLFRPFFWLRLNHIGPLNRLLCWIIVTLTGTGRARITNATVRAGAHLLGTNSQSAPSAADNLTSVPARLGRLLLGEGYPLEERAPRRPDPPPRPEEHRSLLLAMGRDDLPATISMNPTTERLEVTFEDDAFPTLGDEERVMRDVAGALGGTLRTSPIWAFARQPITAHSHGGCALGITTNEYGAVRHYHNLYINDGSLLPSPVGVNPSATIAAIAERNMQNFVTQELRQPQLPWQQTIVDAGQWIATQQRNGVRFAPPAPQSGPPRQGPIGVHFVEAMAGFLSHVEDQPGLLPDPQRARIPVPPFLTAEGAANQAAVGSGNPGAAVAQFNLQAQVVDIGAFLDDRNHIIVLDGTVAIPAGVLRPDSPRLELQNVTGELHLLTDATVLRRTMNYYLPFQFDGAWFTLVGYKEVQDDPGFDAWLDAATLYTEIYRARFNTGGFTGGIDPIPAPAHQPHERDRRRRAPLGPAYPAPVVARGIFRLGIADFLHNQLQGLGATGTTDPARVIWTLGTFGLYFFGTIQRTYSPQIERFLDLFSRRGWRTDRPAAPPRHPATLDIMRGL